MVSNRESCTKAATQEPKGDSKDPSACLTSFVADSTLLPKKRRILMKRKFLECLCEDVVEFSDSVITDSIMELCLLCQQERGSTQNLSNAFNAIGQRRESGPSEHTFDGDSVWIETTQDAEWEEEEDGEELVICRSPLPKGSLLFEQVLVEVAPQARRNGEPASFACSLKLNLDHGRTNQNPDIYDSEVKSSVKKLSWADQKGLPLSSVMSWED